MQTDGIQTGKETAGTRISILFTLSVQQITPESRMTKRLKRMQNHKGQIFILNPNAISVFQTTPQGASCKVRSLRFMQKILSRSGLSVDIPLGQKQVKSGACYTRRQQPCFFFRTKNLRSVRGSTRIRKISAQQFI